MDELGDIDHRSALFVGLTSENLARLVGGFARTTNTPPPVGSLLGEARRTFVGAASCYDNFASSALKALQATELALRFAIGKTEPRETLGGLLRGAEVKTVLTPGQLAWFREFALNFRNKLTHPHESMAMTPGMAEPFLRSAHVVVAEMFPDT